MSTKDEEPETEEYVKVIGNEILFYADVDRENALDFVEKFKKLEIELLKKKAELFVTGVFTIVWLTSSPAIGVGTISFTKKSSNCVRLRYAYNPTWPSLSVPSIVTLTLLTSFE